MTNEVDGQSSWASEAIVTNTKQREYFQDCNPLLCESVSLAPWLFLSARVFIFDCIFV